MFQRLVSTVYNKIDEYLAILIVLLTNLIEIKLKFHFASLFIRPSNVIWWKCSKKNFEHLNSNIYHAFSFDIFYGNIKVFQNMCNLMGPYSNWRTVISIKKFPKGLPYEDKSFQRTSLEWIFLEQLLRHLK